MDWNVKAHEIEEDGSNGFGFVHLKLGQVVSPIDPKMASAGPGSSKRTRGVIQTTYCLVDGCSADLSKCREYHRRHKVCEVHSKTPEVTIAGHNQRFCQQCSRFHSLGEFDEGKRSCRKRLDGHNRRRRKPLPESSSHRRLTLFSNYPDDKMFPFSTDRAGFRNDPFSASSSGKQQFINNNNNNNVFSTNPTILPANLYGYDNITSSNRALSLLSSPHQHQQQQIPETIGLYPSSLHQQYYGGGGGGGGGLNNDIWMESSSSSVMVQNGNVINYQTLMFQDQQSSAQIPHTFPFYWRDV